MAERKEITELKKAAENGDAEARYELAQKYYNNSVKDGTDNESRAVYWYRKAAEQGHAEAQYMYGHCLKCGVGVRFSNARAAAEWFEKAALQGHAEAQAEMYNAYSCDFVCGEWDYEKALFWADKAVRSGNRETEYDLGELYECGTIVKDKRGREIAPDFALAFKYYLSSAEKGYYLAMEKVGDFYCEGKGVEKNLEKAVEWYKKGAEARCYSCWTKLGEMYFDGEYFERDYNKAFECFDKASSADVIARKRIADCYYYGYGVEKNAEEAKNKYLLAAKNDEYGFYGVRMAVARIFAEEGPLHDEKQATALFRLEAHQMGTPESHYEYAIRCLGEGKTDGELQAVYGIERDEKTAALYFKIAANDGHVKASYMYGKCLLNGIGVEADKKAAEEQFKKAAEAGDASARAALEKYFKK